jgi:hypothetical protein
MLELTELKVKYALYSALVYFLISNPETFRLVQSAIGRFVTVVGDCGPTPFGIFFHTLLFFLSMLGLMMLPRDS